MKLIKAKTLADITLTGVKIDLQKVEGNIEAIIITDAEGKYLRIVKDGTYSDFLKILVEEPKQYKVQYKLTAQYQGMQITFASDSEQEVKNKVMDLYLQDGEYSVEEIQVEVGAVQEGKPLDDCPF